MVAGARRQDGYTEERQYVIVVPTHDLVIVRRGLDYGPRAFTRWDFAREVLKAIDTDQAISQQNN